MDKTEDHRRKLLRLIEKSHNRIARNVHQKPKPLSYSIEFALKRTNDRMKMTALIVI